MLNNVSRCRSAWRLSPLFSLCWLGLLSLCATAHARPVDAATYGYPLTNPFIATIATTPSPLQPAGLPDDDAIDQHDYTLDLQPQREFTLPKNFWAVTHLKYRLARQSHPAPLIFLIAGTGSNYSSSTMEFLKKIFYQDGFHVVQISSPTSYDFMAGASRHATPGIATEDARDLYNVMIAIQAQNPDLEVTDYDLAGYSLGALDAAFVSKLDDTEQAFKFHRVLMINPPVNLYTSVSNLDKLVETNVPGVTDTETFYDRIFDKLTAYFRTHGNAQIDEAMLYDFQQSPQGLSNEELAMLIGSVFRFAVADIVFTSDVVNKRGWIVDPDAKITEGTSLTPYLRKSLLCNFDCYIRKQLLPFWQKHEGGTDLNQLIQQDSLYPIADYLHDSAKIAVMTNADDLILGPGDLTFLRRTLGDRLTVYPHGGHCGNLNYRVNVQDMLEFFHG